MQGMLGFSNWSALCIELLTNDYKHISLWLTSDLSVKLQFAIRALRLQEIGRKEQKRARLSTTLKCLRLGVSTKHTSLGSFGFLMLLFVE